MFFAPTTDPKNNQTTNASQVPMERQAPLSQPPEPRPSFYGNQQRLVNPAKFEGRGVLQRSADPGAPPLLQRSPDKPQKPVPTWDQLPGDVQAGLRAGGYEAVVRAGDDKQRLTVLNLYVKLSGMGLWHYVQGVDPKANPGTIVFTCSDLEGLKAELTARKDFVKPDKTPSQWKSREMRSKGQLHFKYWGGNSVEAHIDPYGLLMASPAWWLLPVVPLGQMIAHGATQEAYQDPYQVRDILLSQGWYPQALTTENTKPLQRSGDGSVAAHGGTSTAPPIVHQVLNTNGASLPSTTRSFMEGRFGHDFGSVRIHSDSQAAESAKAVGARAYTVGNHVVFGRNQYVPESGEGRKLLAHELAHTVQQAGMNPSFAGKLEIGEAGDAFEREADHAADGAMRGGGLFSLSPARNSIQGARLQRTLVVDSDPTDSFLPAGDPGRTLAPATRFSMMNGVLSSLCPLFEVDAGTGEVQAKSHTSMTSAFAAGGSNPVGCCCLNVLVNSVNPLPWTIHVAQFESSRTQFAGRNVVLPMTTVPYESGARTAAGNLAIQGQVPNAGHELCGHAALRELGAHPLSGSRLTTDVHDPTVNIENEVSTEQGVPAAELRGLAGAGVHRGESVDRITIRKFPFNHWDVASLPAAEKAKVHFAAAYIKQNNTFADLLGHGDSVGPASENLAVSKARADSVKAELMGLGVTATLHPEGFGAGITTGRFTRVAGLAATQPPPAPLSADPSNWRRVEIQMPVFAAGTEKPPSITPTGVTAAPLNPAVPGLKASGDACTNLLVNKAYP